MDRIKQFLRKLTFSAAILVALFVLVEAIARAVEPGPLSIYDKNPYFELDTPGVFRHRAGFVGRWDGTWYEINSLGLRGPELELTYAEKELRIVALGDSCTFGKGVLEEHAWPRQLERLLAGELGANWRPVVANLGVNGYAGATYKRIFRDIGRTLRPHIVLVGYNLNDFPNTIQAVDDYVFKERKGRKMVSAEVRDFLGRFASYRWLRQNYYAFHREKDWAHAEEFAKNAGAAPIDSNVWIQQEAHLAAIKAEAEKIDAKVAVFLFPYESQVYLDAYDPTPIRRLSESCDSLGLPFIDLAEEFRSRARDSTPPRELFLMGDRYHPNPEGYHMVARRMMAEIEKRGWVPKRD